MRQVLAALDFSPLGDEVVAFAAGLAQACGAELTLLHVAAPDPAFVGYEVGPQHVRDQRAGELRSEHRRLEELGETLRGRGLHARALLVQGATVETILAEAERRGADLIVVGAHRRGRLSKVLLGSVSEALLRRAPCPVAILPPRAE
jgi:nucleotide-binding universal stress UspA family protein